MWVKSKQDWMRERDELLNELRQFAEIIKNRPFQNEYGLRGVSAFALYWFIKKIDPTLVVEVGVWRGFGTWLIEQAAPNAEIICMDPIFMFEGYLDMDRVGRVYRSGRAQCSAQDFSCSRIMTIAAEHARPMAFFDDHQNKLPRLFQAREAGIKDIVFDDNTSAFYTHRTLEQERHDPTSLAILESEVREYQIFPALWDVDFVLGPQHINEKGLDFPREAALEYVFSERQWHSYVTYVSLQR